MEISYSEIHTQSRHLLKFIAELRERAYHPAVISGFEQEPEYALGNTVLAPAEGQALVGEIEHILIAELMHYKCIKIVIINVVVIYHALAAQRLCVGKISFVIGKVRELIAYSPIAPAAVFEQDIALTRATRRRQLCRPDIPASPYSTTNTSARLLRSGSQS